MRSAVFAPFFLFATLWLQAGPGRPGEDENPSAVQQRAIHRIDEYVDAYRKTGDLRSGWPGLLRARDELGASEIEFARRGDLASAALSAIKQGDIFRMASSLERNQEARDQALKLYRRGEEFARQARHPKHQAEALIGQMRVESTLPDWGAASSHIEQAVRLCEPLEDKALLVEAQSYAAHVQLGRGNTLEAAESLNRALTLATKLGDPVPLFFLYSDRADVHQSRAKLADFEHNFPFASRAIQLAGEDYKLARAIALERGFRHLAEETDRRLKRLNHEQNLMDMNFRHYDILLKKKIFEPQRFDGRGLVVTEDFIPAPGVPGAPPGVFDLIKGAMLEDFTGDAASYAVLGRSRELRGANDEALQAYKEGVAVLENDRRHLGDEQGRRTFFEDKVGCYHAAIRHYLQRKKYAEAFDLMERSRARVLADLLASRDLGFSRPKERELDVRYRVLEARIGREQGELFRARRPTDRAPDPAEIARIEASIRNLEVERRQLLDRMALEAPRLRDLYVSEPATLQDLQQFARREEVTVLDYLVLRDSVIVWLIDGQEVKVRSVFLPRYVLAEKVAALIDSLKERSQIPDSVFDEDKAQSLFEFLIRPMLSSMKTERLVIFPHENLNEVPFEVLLDRTDRRYLGERFRITYAPSATVLLRLKEPKRFSTGQMLVVANTTIDDNESAEVDQLFSRRCEVFKDVRPAELKALVAERDFLHFTVHGRFEKESPWLSLLILRGDDPKHEALHAAEMFGLPLREASLVVLSACETGQSEITHGNEMSGMVPPLIYAGAGTLVLTRWKVDSDTTRLWVKTFYQEGRTQPPGEAARRALLEVKKNEKYQHPYYWASFLVIGR